MFSRVSPLRSLLFNINTYVKSHLIPPDSKSGRFQGLLVKRRKKTCFFRAQPKIKIDRRVRVRRRCWPWKPTPPGNKPSIAAPRPMLLESCAFWLFPPLTLPPRSPDTWFVDCFLKHWAFDASHFPLHFLNRKTSHHTDFFYSFLLTIKEAVDLSGLFLPSLLDCLLACLPASHRSLISCFLYVYFFDWRSEMQGKRKRENASFIFSPQNFFFKKQKFVLF